MRGALVTSMRRTAASGQRAVCLRAATAQGSQQQARLVRPAPGLAVSHRLLSQRLLVRGYSSNAQDRKPEPAGPGADERKEAKQGEEAEETPEPGRSTKGETVTLLGLSTFGLSMVLRNPVAARALRVAGPVGMAFGAVMSIYEIGGWRLLFSIPAAVLGYGGVVYMTDGSFETRFKDEAAGALQEACPHVPGSLLQAFREGKGTEYETNRLRVEVEWPEGAPQWRLQATATRSWKFEAWTLQALQAAVAKRADASVETPPPQTRHWDRDGSVTWQVVWQR